MAHDIHIGLDPANFFVSHQDSSQKNNSQKRFLRVITRAEYTDWVNHQTQTVQDWLENLRFSPEVGKTVLIPQENHHLLALVIRGESVMDSLAAAYDCLPAGDYYSEGLTGFDFIQAAIGWGLQGYKFERYKKNRTSFSKRLIVSDQALEIILNYCQAHYLIRDLINTPAEDMGPSELALWAEKIAQESNAQFECITGQDLLNKNFPAIHAVGRASDDEPRLIQFSWGNPKNPKVTLIGKGVCFDTGGLDLKDAEGMRWMKKDMGGAAHVLGLAKLIMAAQLPIYLTVYIPAVENAVAGNAYRPGDVIKTRKGLTVEIGNTDAEGRVILSDALCLASENQAELIIDFATLTGAARVALGADLPALFSNDQKFSSLILEMGLKYEDPLWPMPLHQPYKAHLKSNIADLNNMSKVSYGGAITAALFLENFVGENITWCHIDLMAFNTSSRPGKPEGGEAMALRAVFHAIEKKYGTQ